MQKNLSKNMRYADDGVPRRAMRLKKPGSWVLVGGEEIHNVHHRSKCAPGHCAIHNPSKHHMRPWKQHWRDDRGIIERICPHGIGHPDPDQPEWVDGVHGCDGCCHPPPPPAPTERLIVR
jgi:hypothetical protein